MIARAVKLLMETRGNSLPAKETAKSDAKRLMAQIIGEEGAQFGSSFGAGWRLGRNQTSRYFLLPTLDEGFQLVEIVVVSRRTSLTPNRCRQGLVLIIGLARQHHDGKQTELLFRSQTIATPAKPSRQGIIESIIKRAGLGTRNCPPGAELLSSPVRAKSRRTDGDVLFEAPFEKEPIVDVIVTGRALECFGLMA